MKHNFKRGDVVERKNGIEYRVILATVDKLYFYLDYDKELNKFFINPTKGAVSITTMDSNFTKVGVIKNYKKLSEDFFDITRKFNEVFAYSEKQLSKHVINYND